MRGLATLLAAASVLVLAGVDLPFPVTARRRLPETSLRRAPLVGAAAGLVAWAVSGVPVLAGAVGLLGVGAVVATGGRRAAKQRREMTRRWPDFLAALRSSLAGGATMSAATLSAAATAGAPFAATSDRLSAALRAGTPFVDALTTEQSTLADPIADRVLATLRFATETGGRRVGEMLAALSRSVADEVRLRLAHEASMTEQRLTAAVALLAPWALLVLTVTTNPTAADAYRSSTGVAIVVAGLVLTVVGHRLALRTARLSEPRRIFR